MKISQVLNELQGGAKLYRGFANDPLELRLVDGNRIPVHPEIFLALIDEGQIKQEADSSRFMGYWVPNEADHAACV